jgi:hypothetical protein
MGECAGRTRSSWNLSSLRLLFFSIESKKIGVEKESTGRESARDTRLHLAEESELAHSACRKDVTNTRYHSYLHCSKREKTPINQQYRWVGSYFVGLRPNEPRQRDISFLRQFFIQREFAEAGVRVRLQQTTQLFCVTGGQSHYA